MSSMRNAKTSSISSVYLFCFRGMCLIYAAMQEDEAEQQERKKAAEDQAVDITTVDAPPPVRCRLRAYPQCHVCATLA